MLVSVVGGVAPTRAAIVAVPNFANASLVGANTVNGPGPLKVEVKPAAVTAVTSVLRAGVSTAS